MEELLWKHGRDILTSPGMEKRAEYPAAWLCKLL